VTFTPLLLAALGTVTYWPDNPRRERTPSGLRGWSERQIIKRWVAVPTLLLLGAGLVFAALQATAATHRRQSRRRGGRRAPDRSRAPRRRRPQGAVRQRRAVSHRLR
jgi:hypothetical protein